MVPIFRPARTRPGWCKPHVTASALPLHLFFFPFFFFFSYFATLFWNRVMILIRVLAQALEVIRSIYSCYYAVFSFPTDWNIIEWGTHAPLHFAVYFPVFWKGNFVVLKLVIAEALRGRSYCFALHTFIGFSSNCIFSFPSIFLPLYSLFTQNPYPCCFSNLQRGGLSSWPCIAFWIPHTPLSIFILFAGSLLSLISLPPSWSPTMLYLGPSCLSHLQLYVFQVGLHIPQRLTP